ncbi:N-acetyltransferase [Paracoccus limosus]|uniref:N-acetyltransferase n=1 Tax=Paracoccus limosus TaxID=913252 RepID=A0A844H212_9RHOB|nr:GNAT family N-acetyltransferase [Paracoccus limosus]MTH33503.1 N-acetyltransferase [Paracoccus limosus]
MSQPAIRVTHEDLGTAGRYVVHMPGIDPEAELTWRSASPGVIVADHTYAPPQMRGTGVAEAMVQQLIADARNKGLRIVPACSYVRAQFDRHPDWAGLRAEA